MAGSRDDRPFVRVDCDFGADGLWDERGAAYTPELLELSPALAVALRAWQLHHDEATTVISGNPFNEAEHDRIGRQIATLVQQERPDLRVVYDGDEPYPGEHRLR